MLLLAGCVGPGGGGGGLPDTDGDGLADEWEQERDLDSESVDTDEDGWTDDEEVYGFADPLDEMDHPYDGGWERSPWPEDLESAGQDVGDIADDFRLLDQFGEEVSLWSFYGRVILVENVAEW
jgi:hypothetical protein